jgi:hypothetical protein
MSQAANAPNGANAASNDVAPNEVPNELPIPAETGHGHIIEIPATRSSISDVHMQRLSLSPSMKDRRGSRNSFGVSLPIPREPRKSSRLSVVGKPISHVRNILASELQDQEKEKVKKVKNMVFCFDIDGVLAHGNNAIPEAQAALKMLNGDNELGMSYLLHYLMTQC